MKAIIITFVLLLFSQTNAYEEVEICAKYKTEYSWSKGYKVQSKIMKGTELNQATNSFRYESFSTYIVIFWDNDEVSIIKMYFPYLSVIGQDGEDQEGRLWNIAKTNICF